MARPVPYPLLARLLLELELLQRLRAARLEGLELLLLEGPLVGDPGVLLDLLPLARPALLLGLLTLLAVVLFHLAQHLVLLAQRDALALALLALLHHLAAAFSCLCRLWEERGAPLRCGGLRL